MSLVKNVGYLLIMIIAYSLFLSLDDLFPVSLQEKLGDGIVEPRSLEDEGIFVGKKPVVPTNLVHRAEKRILQECAIENKVTVAKTKKIQQRRFS